MTHQVLCVGMSDSSAGSGIQADIKTIQALGGYAATVITAVSVQNTQNVFDSFQIPTEIVRLQLQVVMDDLKPKVIKTGMLSHENTINVVGDFLDEYKNQGLKFVVDPVMTSRTGKMLLDKAARDAIKRRLLIYADVLTPNIREAQDLTGMTIKDVDDMKHAAEMLMTLGCKNIILKGGSLSSDVIYNVFFDDKGPEIFERPRYVSKATHGAGTTLSSGIAVGLAKGLSTRQAFISAQDYLAKAIETAKKIGQGFGPVNHAYVFDIE